MSEHALEVQLAIAKVLIFHSRLQQAQLYLQNLLKVHGQNDKIMILCSQIDARLRAHPDQQTSPKTAVANKVNNQ